MEVTRKKEIFQKKIEVGSQGGIRTPDMVVNSHPLCQLSYLGISWELAKSSCYLYQISPLFVNKFLDIQYPQHSGFIECQLALYNPDSCRR